MPLFGIDPEEDRLRIRALRASPPRRASLDDERRQVFSAALGQFDELLTAAGDIGPASSPLPLYYALNQAGRAISAALQQPDRPWQPKRHGLSIADPDERSLGQTKISPQKLDDGWPDSFSILAEAINAPRLTTPTMLANVWAAIPGLEEPGLGAGCPRALPVEVDMGAPLTMIGTLRKLRGLVPSEAGKTQLLAMLEHDYVSSASGVTVEDITPGLPPHAGATARLFWRFADGRRRPVGTVATRYLWAQGLWLLPSLGGQGDTLPPVLLWWCLLHALSHLARYHPAAWIAALDPDRSRFAVPIEKALSTALAVVPRLVLLELSPGAYDL